MKLLFCIKQLHTAAGGAERVFCTLCSELAARGHSVTVITFDAPDQPPFYGLDQRVRRVGLAIGDPSRSAGVGETLRRMAALRAFVRSERPDVAVGFMHSMFVPLALALTGMRTPVVGSEHIVPEHYKSRPLQYLLLVATAPLLSAMTVLSSAIRRRYPDCVRRRMHVVPNPVHVTDTSAQAAQASEPPVLLCVGRMDAQKDHATLLRSFAQLSPQFPSWQLRIVGDGSLRADLTQLTSTLGLGSRVSMPGVTHQIDAEYRRAEAFVLSSRYESFGLATAEAMSHGLPVVGFADCPGTNELISSGQTGLLVDPGADRVSALTDALRQLLGDPALRRRLGDAGQLAIGDRFSTARVCSTWEQLFVKVAS
jgi:GalNAc-alpha-(1->4)-GalNAc-alpha-(1->3)-diNAcBac-PP-undecaprenol alpha-1,4-N-acetyl-D-galactosaminyltransferase